MGLVGFRLLGSIPCWRTLLHQLILGPPGPKSDEFSSCSPLQCSKMTIKRDECSAAQFQLKLPHHHGHSMDIKVIISIEFPIEFRTVIHGTSCIFGARHITSPRQAGRQTHGWNPRGGAYGFPLKIIVFFFHIYVSLIDKSSNLMGH